MTPIRLAEQTYRAWSSPILLELKEREHQLEPAAREALQNILLERRLVDVGSPSGVERRNAGDSDRRE
ncbi:hypothetical protein ACF6ZU_25385 [Pseudomonas migulae]|jgi:hypothetical protein|uniref:hypothetical protein n=1 Tax=Pseudomonas migulae TaxID=78543 RepID=UPI003718CB6A